MINLRRKSLISKFLLVKDKVSSYFLECFRIFYIQLLTLTCEKCNLNFFHVYLSFNPINCPLCSQEYCQYCIEIKNNDSNRPHNAIRCRQRYVIIYYLALLAFLILYLKFVFICNSYYVTKYLTASLFILEYIIFSDKVDNLINTFISIKNIILGLLILGYYDEKDILIYIFTGMVQLIFILLINLMKDILREKFNQVKSAIINKIFKEESNDEQEKENNPQVINFSINNNIAN